MTQDTEPTLYSLSRRKMLAGLGAVGLASAGAGLGTTAYLSDEESFDGNALTAGTLDLFVDYDATYYSDGAAQNMADSASGTVDGTPAGTFYDLQDVKPGDSGKVEFCFRIDDNPAYMWACGGITQDENGMNEPEMAVDDTSEGELGDSIEATLSYCDGEQAGAEIVSGSLVDVFAALEFGAALDGTGMAGMMPGDQAAYSTVADGHITGPCLCLDWELPYEVGNEVQSDTLSMALEFHALQARHNDGTTNPCASGTGFSSVSYEKALNMQALAAVQNNAEIQIHGDSGGVEYDFADKFAANTDIPFSATIDVGAATASLAVLGETVMDDDVTDGDANGAGTADPEWPGGIPGTVDVAINAHSKDGNGVTTVVKDVSVNSGAALPEISSDSGNVYYVVPGVDSTTDVTVTGTMRFEGAQSDFSSQDWVGIDFR